MTEPGDLEAVIFDVDGTLVDSERSGHRVAFNQAFEHFRVTDRWDEETYRELLAVTGGEQRLNAWFADPRSCVSTQVGHERRELARRVHRWKTERFRLMAETGEIPARPGVADLLEELTDAGARLGIATTGSRRWVEPLLERTFENVGFEVIVTGDDVSERKPDPQAFDLACSRLHVGRGNVVAVEDSGPGLLAATRAGLTTTVVANAETDWASVRSADLVITAFDSGATMLADPFHVWQPGRLSFDVLAALLRAAVAP